MRSLLVVCSFALLTACATTQPLKTLGGHHGAALLELELTPVEGALGVEPLVGTLWVGWIDREQDEALRSGGRIPRILDIVMWSRVRRRVTLGAGAKAPGMRLPCPAGASGAVLAVFDHQRQFWPTFFGSGGTGNLAGATLRITAPGAGETRKLRVDLRKVPKLPKRKDLCQGPRFEQLKVPGPPKEAGEGPAQRRLCVYLPSSYGAAPGRRYPVVYLLPGLMGDGTGYFSRHADIHGIADELGSKSGREAILVAVDTTHALGSSYLEDSGRTGSWARFMRLEVIRAVDGRYRTVPKPRARALLGASTGGFNAVSFAMRFPDVFATVAALVPDGLDFESWLLTDERRVKPLWLAVTRLEDAVGGAGQMSSYAADWSPELTSHRGFVWPFDLATGKLDAKRWARWRDRSPLRMLERPEMATRVGKQLHDRIFIGAALEDEFGLYQPAKRFVARLLRLGIKHRFVSYPGGHTTDPKRRLEEALEFCLSRLAE